MRVAFDFDSTLSEGDVQHFAKQLKDFEIWIVTSRVPDEKAPSDNWNNDLWFVCDQLNIPKHRVVFTSYISKHEFFWEKDFLFHLDDDPDEIRMINALTDTIAVIKQDGWRERLSNLITQKREKTA